MQKKKRRKRTSSEISSLVKELNSGLSVAQLAMREGVSVGAVYQWKKKVGLRQSEPIELLLPANANSPSGNAFSGVSVEVNSIKCAVEPGFDRETLVAVIEAISHSNKGNKLC